MNTKYEDEIAQIAEERAKLATRMNALVKMKDIENSLRSCGTDGHVWTLTMVGSDLWDVTDISLLCTRCAGQTEIEFAGNSNHRAAINWDYHEISEIRLLLESENEK